MDGPIGLRGGFGTGEVGEGVGIQGCPTGRERHGSHFLGDFGGVGGLRYALISRKVWCRDVMLAAL